MEIPPCRIPRQVKERPKADADLAHLAGLLRRHDEMAQARLAFGYLDLQIGDFLPAGFGWRYGRTTEGRHGSLTNL
jgi:hypothetical protein